MENEVSPEVQEMIAVFDALPEDEKQEIREGITEKYRQLATKHSEDIIAHLKK